MAVQSRHGLCTQRCGERHDLFLLALGRLQGLRPRRPNLRAWPAILFAVATNNKTGPEIDYPTAWGYRIVGTCEDDIRAHVLEVLAGVEHELVLARRSSGGRYLSLHLSLVVEDEAQRLAIYEHLVRHEAIRFVV